MASAIQQLIAQQSGPDILGSIARGVQTAGMVQQLRDAPAQRELAKLQLAQGQQRLDMGAKQLAQVDQEAAAAKQAAGLKLAADAAILMDREADPSKRAAIYQQVRAQAAQMGHDVSPWPEAYSPDVEPMLAYARQNVYGAQDMEQRNKLELERVKASGKGPVSGVGKLLADRSVAERSGAPAEVLAAYDAAIAKAGRDSSNVTVNVGDNQPLTKPTLNAVQQDILGAEKTVSDLKSIAEKYSDDFLTYEGRAKAAVGGVMDKLGMENSVTGFNAKRAEFKNSIMQFFNQYRKEITGAAASEKELQQLMDSMFNQNLGPQEFKAAYGQFFNKVEKNMEINKQAAREGLDVGGKPKYTHPEFGEITESDIATTMQENGMTREEVIQALGLE